MVRDIVLAFNPKWLLIFILFILCLHYVDNEPSVSAELSSYFQLQIFKLLLAYTYFFGLIFTVYSFLTFNLVLLKQL